MRESGASYTEIGRVLGVSAQRARQLVEKARRSRAAATRSLDARTRNYLQRNGIVFSSREELRAILQVLREKKALGPKALRQIERWLEFDS
jgi:hypothetical protein